MPEIEILNQHQEAEIKELEAEIERLRKIVREQDQKISTYMTREAVVDARALCVGMAKKAIQDAVRSLEWGTPA